MYIPCGSLSIENMAEELVFSTKAHSLAPPQSHSYDFLLASTPEKKKKFLNKKYLLCSHALSLLLFAVSPQYDSFQLKAPRRIEEKG